MAMNRCAWYFVWALGLVLVSTHGGLATNCLSGLFACKGKSAYELLANHVSEATPETTLEANGRAATGLFRAHGHVGELEALASALKSLKGSDEAHKDVFCGRSNMAALRLLAEAMQSHGNVRPDKITPSVARLNRLIIKVVDDAWTGCLRHLESKWPEYRSNLADFSIEVSRLHDLPTAFVYNLFRAQSSQTRARRVAGALARRITWNMGLNLNKKPTRPDNERAPEREVVAHQLEMFILTPCRQFVALELAAEPPLSATYLDLLVARLLIRPFMMANFYEDKSARPPSYWQLVGQDNNYLVTEWAKNYGACAQLTAMPAKDLVKEIIEHRKRPSRPGDLPGGKDSEDRDGARGVGIKFFLQAAAV